MDTATIVITSLSATGEGVGSWDGLKVFVEGALPQETVTVTLQEQKKRYAIAALRSIDTPSPDRITPLCPIFGECGGCQIMHLSYEAQLAVKRQRVVDALERIAGFQAVSVAPCIPSPMPLGYRNKIQLPIVWEDHHPTIGMYRKNSHTIVPLTRCAIQSALGEAILVEARTRLKLPSVRYLLIRTAHFTEEALVTLVTDAAPTQALTAYAHELLAAHPAIQGVMHTLSSTRENTILGETFTTLAGKPYLTEKLLHHTFRIGAAAFFQINPRQTEQLYSYILDQAALTPRDQVVDAYCGVGTLAILAASGAQAVWGIECVEAAIVNAQENAALNACSNVTFRTGLAEKQLGAYDADVVLLNPPRKGCHPRVLETLLQKRPKRLIYISCDPATLARDLAMLAAHYSCHAIQPFDMFPQTMHVESVATLTCLIHK